MFIMEMGRQAQQTVDPSSLNQTQDVRRDPEEDSNLLLNPVFYVSTDGQISGNGDPTLLFGVPPANLALMESFPQEQIRESNEKTLERMDVRPSSPPAIPEWGMVGQRSAQAPSSPTQSITPSLAEGLDLIGVLQSGQLGPDVFPGRPANGSSENQLRAALHEMFEMVFRLHHYPDGSMEAVKIWINWMSKEKLLEYFMYDYRGLAEKYGATGTDRLQVYVASIVDKVSKGIKY